MWSVPCCALICYLLPKCAAKAFPQIPDGLIGERLRMSARKIFDGTIDLFGDKVKRVVRVIIPDNIFFAGAIVPFYLAKTEFPLEKEDALLVVVAALTTIVACHTIRELSYSIAAPIANKVPYVGQGLKDFFRYLGPSDLSQA